MASSLSTDLRERVVKAVAEGVSRRQAAARFGVSVASAIRWQESFEREGRVSAKPRGGDQRSQHIEAHADLIRSLDGGLFNSALRLIVSTRSVKAALCETLERIPARWVVIQHMRERFSCRDCETIAQTPAPSIRSRGVGLGRTS